MARVAFLNVSAPGHVIPTLSLVRELVGRGEEVVYFEAARFQREIEAFGAKFCAYPDVQGETGPAFVNELSVAPVLTWYALQVLPGVLAAVGECRPDYLIHDSLCLWGWVIARKLGIPAINSIATAAFCDRSFYGSPVIGPWLGALLDPPSPVRQQFREWECQLRQRWSTPEIELLHAFTNPEQLNICYLPGELQPHVELFNGTFHFVGSGEPVRATEDEFPFALLNGAPLIYISFGTVHDPGVAFYQNCMEAFRGLPVQVVMLTGPRTPPGTLGEVPPNFLVCPSGTVPQLALLERAKLFITHGAGGGVREGAWFGVPMLAVPQTLEQTEISQRIQQNGSGIQIRPEQVTADLLGQSAIRLLSDPQYLEGAKKVRLAAHNAGGPKLAADLILDFVS